MRTQPFARSVAATLLPLSAALLMTACGATTRAAQAQAPAQAPAAAAAAQKAGGMGTPGGIPSGVPPVYAPMPARPEGPLDPWPAGYKVDAIDFTLMPGQSVEYKYRLAEGATMIYTWKSDRPVRFDFHTVPDGQPITASERFNAAETREAHGIYKAPYAGLHGWWWENNGKEEVTIRIQTAGFYTQAMMFAGGDPEPFEVQDPPPPPTF